MQSEKAAHFLPIFWIMSDAFQNYYQEYYIYFYGYKL